MSAAAGVVVVATVVFGGMRSITFVRAFPYWLKLTALAVPAVVLVLVFAGGDRGFGTADLTDRTTVEIGTDVELRVSEPVAFRAVGELDGRAVAGPGRPGGQRDLVDPAVPGRDRRQRPARDARERPRSGALIPPLETNEGNDRVKLSPSTGRCVTGRTFRTVGQPFGRRWSTAGPRCLSAGRAPADWPAEWDPSTRVEYSGQGTPLVYGSPAVHPNGHVSDVGSKGKGR